MPRIEQIQKLLAAQPDDIELHYMLAMELRSNGDHDAAVAKFDECIALNAGYTPAYFQKASTFLAAGRTDDARAALNVGIQQARAAGDEHAAEEMQGLLATL